MVRQKKERPHISWLDLRGHIAPEVLYAPKTGGDPVGGWPPVHGRIVAYFQHNVVGTPWADHLALIASVLAARRRDVQTIRLTVMVLNARFSSIFAALGLTEMSEWKHEDHLPIYLRGEIVPDDSQYMRQQFFTRYRTATKQTQSWLEGLPEEERQRYRPFTFPVVSQFLHEQLSDWKELIQKQQEHRKAETEAVVPRFAELRAEAHYRYNRMCRLRQAYLQAVSQVLPDHSNLPLDFSYEEGDPPLERLHFRLWDRKSFVLDPAQISAYAASTREKATYGGQQYAVERNEVFLEYVKAERLQGDGPAEGLWFADILRLGLLGSQGHYGSAQENAARQAWLRQWGYGEEHAKDHEHASPFTARISGLLSWPDGKTNGGEGSMGRFIAQARQRTGKVFVPVEPLYATVTFALLALDLLTTTGMRNGELHQINVLPECLIRLVDDPPPAAQDQSPRVRYVLRLLPKGEQTNALHNYGIGKESVRLIEKTAQMLCEHYKLKPGEPLPRVPFNPNHNRSHRFEGPPVPYIFQYNRTHITDGSINAFLRFLLHGMVFQTRSGTPVVIRPHLLRHAFATYAVNIEGVPIDLVAKWLQQKNLEVTGYYSEIPEYMQVEQHSSFVARLATQINVREAILRSPEELQKQAEAARRRVGMLVPVAGGECMLDAYCPNQFDCIHCPAKAPDPEKQYQVEEKQRWAVERLAYYEREGLVLEAEKMKQLLRACDLELKEMQMIIAYRKDETRVIQIQPRPKRPS
jgi:hypothetical protein